MHSASQNVHLPRLHVFMVPVQSLAEQSKARSPSNQAHLYGRQDVVCSDRLSLVLPGNYVRDNKKGEKAPKNRTSCHSCQFLLTVISACCQVDDKDTTSPRKGSTGVLPTVRTARKGLLQDSPNTGQRWFKFDCRGANRGCWLPGFGRCRAHCQVSCRRNNLPFQ